jgi:hypothetical protein
MENTIHTFTPDTKLPHNKLEKLGFKWVENLQVYQCSFSDSYYSSVIEVKVIGDSASVFLTDIHSKWSRGMARKAITALSSQDEYPDSFDICLGEVSHEN